MANINIIPTRMELTRLKKKLVTAQRGHKLLKDKRDELMKSFLETVRDLRTLRSEVEEELMTVHRSFTVASALMSSEAMEQALLYPKQNVELTTGWAYWAAPLWRIFSLMRNFSLWTGWTLPVSSSRQPMNMNREEGIFSMM